MTTTIKSRAVNVNVPRYKWQVLFPLLAPKMLLAIVALAAMTWQYTNFMQSKKRLKLLAHYTHAREVEMRLLEEQAVTFRYLYGLATLTELKDHRMNSDISVRQLRMQWGPAEENNGMEKMLYKWSDLLEKWRGEVFAQNVEPDEGREHYANMIADLKQNFVMQSEALMPKNEVHRINVVTKSLQAFFLLRDELAHAVGRNMPLSGPVLEKLMRKKAEMEHYLWWLKESFGASVNTESDRVGAHWTLLNNHLMMMWQKSDQGNYGILPKKIMEDTFEIERELIMTFMQELRGMQVNVKSAERYHRTMFLAYLGVFLVGFFIFGSYLYKKWRALTFAYAYVYRKARHMNRSSIGEIVNISDKINDDDDMLVTLGAMRPYVTGVKQTLLKIKGTWAQMELVGATEGEVVLEELRPLWQQAYQDSTKAMEILQESLEMNNSEEKVEGEESNVTSLSNVRSKRNTKKDIEKNVERNLERKTENIDSKKIA